MNKQRSQSIWKEIDALAAARYWNRLIRAFCQFFVLAILVVVVAVAIDFVFRLESAAARAFVFVASVLSLIGLAVVTIARSVVAGIDQRKAAEAIEHENEIESGRLQNSLIIRDHLKGRAVSNPMVVGSDELCHKTIESVDANFENVIRPKIWGRESTTGWLFCFICVAGSFVILSGMFYPQFDWALKRLALPFDGSRWPTKTRLEFVALPSDVAIGEAVDIQIVNRKGTLPEDLAVEVRESKNSAVTLHAVSSDGKTGRYRLADVRRDFQIRAIGGDDQSMHWRDVRVSRPAELNEVLVTVRPPKIYDLPERVVPDRVVELIAGSEVSIRGSWDAAIKTAEVRVIESNSTDSRFLDSGIELVIEDGVSFSIVDNDHQSLVINKSIEFEITWITEAGLQQTSEKRWRLRCIADAAPEVFWTSSARLYEVTADGIIPFDFAVQDDFGIREFGLVCSDNLGSEYVGTANKKSDWKLNGSPGDGVTRYEKIVGGPEALEYSSELHLKELLDRFTHGLNDQVRFIEARVTATDWIEQTSESEPIRIVIVSEPRARTTLQLLLDSVSQSLSRAIRSGESFLRHGNELESLQGLKRQLEISKQALREFNSNLTQNRDSVMNEANRLKEQNRRSGVNDPNLDALARQIESELMDLADLDFQTLSEPGDGVERDEFLKAMPTTLENVGDVISKLRKIQDQVATEQSSLAVDQLVRSISVDQQELASRTVAASDLDDQSIARLAAEQLDLSNDFDEQLLRLQTTADEISAQRLALIAKQRITDSMRSAASSIKSRNWNQARRSHESIRRSFDVLLGGGERSEKSKNDSGAGEADESAAVRKNQTDLLDLLREIRAEQSALNIQVARAKERLDRASDSSERNAIWGELQVLSNEQNRLSDQLAEIGLQIQSPP